MARSAKAGGKRGAGKARNAPSAKDRAKAKRPVQSAVRLRPSTASHQVLKEAREQQAATAEILKVIASSPSDVQPVFNAIAASANRLIAGYSTAVHRVVDDIVYLVAFTPTNPTADEALKAAFPQPRSEMPILDLIKHGETALFADAEKVNEHTRQLARARGWRSLTVTPLMSRGALIGYIVCTRREAGLLADHHVQLLRTFADQAVIAIKNVELFEEVQAKTRDLEESLQQQTATAEVLEVISRSAFDLKAVFDAVAENSVKLCDADRAIIFRYDGKLLHIATAFNTAPGFIEWIAQNPISPGRHSGAARAALERRTVHIPDVRTDPEYVYGAKDVEAIRTIVGVPIIKGRSLLGVIMIYRLEVNPFTDKQIALVETFADQAAIAIENSRLFDDTREALEQQTATGDVLKIISRSSVDLETVLETLVETVARLCRADQVYMFHLRHDLWHLIADYGLSVEAREFFETNPFTPGRGSTSGRAAMELRAVSVTDVFRIRNTLSANSRRSPAIGRRLAFRCFARIR